MTNKLPIVGKRYKCKTRLGEFVCDEIAMKSWINHKNEFCLEEYVYMLDRNYGEDHIKEELKTFWDYYEELPDSNSQKPEEVQEIGVDICKEEASSYMAHYRNFCNEFNKIKKERKVVYDNGKICCQLCGTNATMNDAGTIFLTCSCSNKVNETPNPVDLKKKEVNETPNPVDLKKKEVSEVERALEGVKQLLELSPAALDEAKRNIVPLKNKLAAEAISTMIELTEIYNDKCQNLVNALEAEKANTHQLNTPVKDEYTPVEPATDDNKQDYYEAISKYPEGIRAHSFYPYEPCKRCSDPKVYAEFVSKPEPKIDMKEERVEPEACLNCGKTLTNDNIDGKFCADKGYYCHNQFNKKAKRSAVKERVEPVSIWKDVSELPTRLEQLLIKFHDGDALLGKYNPHDDLKEEGWQGCWYNISKAKETALKSYEIKQWATLADFINSFEQMQKDIEGLKRK